VASVTHGTYENAEVSGMKIVFLYSEDCPSYEVTLSRLRKVVEEEGINAEITSTKVETDDQAQQLHFAGSPTILIDGRDIDPPINPKYALTCRAYRLEDGRVSPIPSIMMMRRAVRMARKE
jgi:hypothetical protein